MYTFSTSEIQHLKKLFQNELKMYQVHIGKFTHTPIQKDDKQIDKIINTHSIDEMLAIIEKYEKKYNYRLPSKNGDEHDLATIIFHLNIDPFFYNTPFEILPKYTLFDLAGFSCRQIYYICKQFNLNPNYFNGEYSTKVFDFTKGITADQRRNFLEVCKKIDIVIL